MSALTNIDVSFDAAFAVDRDHSIVLWNPAAEKTFGYPTSTAVGQPCWQLLHGKDSYGNRYCCEHCPIMEMASEHEQINSFSVSFRTATDQREKFAIACLTVFDETGNEQLLHICHPEGQVPEGISNPVVSESLAASHLGTLSKREIEVLSLLADGKSTRDIARLMGITAPTVRNHIQHMLYKLHVHNRLEAVMLGKRLDII